MEQHPIPRQITTFEFKLVGFMTLHQFLYLLVFIPTGFLMYKIIPVPVLNIIAAAAVSAVGILLAFLPVNDRPLEVFIQNLFKRLTSPTQYVYKNSGSPMAFAQTSISDSAAQTAAHLDAQSKLNQYLQTKAKSSTDLKQRTVDFSIPDAPSPLLRTADPEPATVAPPPAAEPSAVSAPKAEKQPFFIGSVMNNKQGALPDVLVYVKNENGEPVRLLKTNPHGVFATFNTLPRGRYTLEAKDPRGAHLFDPIMVPLEDVNTSPVTIMEKGLL